MSKSVASVLKKALLLCCAAAVLASCAIPGVGLREAGADPYFPFPSADADDPDAETGTAEVRQADPTPGTDTAGTNLSVQPVAEKAETDPPSPAAPAGGEPASPETEPAEDAASETEPPKTEPPETEPAVHIVLTPDLDPESDPDPEPEPEPAPPAKRFSGVDVSFLAVGDNLIHENIHMDASYRGTADKAYDFLPMYYDVADKIASADVAFINQETVMAGADWGYTGWPCFNCPQQLGRDMAALGFDVVNLANNHMLDKTADGLLTTVEFWDTQPVTTIGAYKDEEDASRIRTVERDGVVFAWLAYTLGTNGIVKPASSPVVVPYIDDDLILSDLERAKEAGDFVIVSIHWGLENTQTPTDEQVRLARLIADGGADVILGHHSHTLQPIEWLDTDRGRTLCIYSLGNFVSGMSNPVNMVGGLFEFRVISDDDGRLVPADPVLEPTVFYYGMDWFNTHVYMLYNYTPEIAATHGVAISGYTLTPDAARRYVTNVIEPEFLPDWMK